MSASQRDHSRVLLAGMMRIRHFEETCAELYSSGLIRGFLHLYVGQEAVAVGVAQALEPADYVVATYREHAHAIIRDVAMDAVMAEMFGKFEGCSRGRGGSMHLFCTERNFYGGHAIVGGGLPMAVGLALAASRLQEERITVCFFGEGAVAEGEFHESLNLAALWNLPVLFICENNGYAMGTALARSESERDIAAKARSYGIPAASVDGMDVLAVEEASRSAARDVRSGGPRLLECATYRFRAHSMYDPELYRTREEVEEWKRRDPIATFEDRAIKYGWLNEEEVAAIRAAVSAEVADAVAFAERGSVENTANLTTDVYAPTRSA